LALVHTSGPITHRAASGRLRGKGSGRSSPRGTSPRDRSGVFFGRERVRNIRESKEGAVAHVQRSIEVDAPVETIEQEWQRFEDLPRCAAHSLHVNVRWRAEVLTIEPTPSGARITLKIEFEPSGGEGALPCRLEATLRSFATFLELRRARTARMRAPQLA
jgi:hypothetical protein